MSTLSGGRKYWARVIYKSGASQELFCDDLTVRRKVGGIAHVEWDNADPDPLVFGVDEIAAIWYRETGDKR